MTDGQQELLNRWNAFLAKIDERLKELMAEAEEGLAGVFAEFGDDVVPLNNALGALDHRVGQLREKVGETWDGQVSDRFAEAGGGAFLDVGLDRKHDALAAFERTWLLFKAGAQSKFFRALWDQASAAMQKAVPCRQCGAPLTIENPRLTASVPCAHCRAVNQIVPEKAVQAYYSAAPHAFADAATLPLRFAIDDFRTEVDRKRRAQNWANESLESLRRWEQMEIAYWAKYVEVRGQVLGEPPDQELLESRVGQFRRFSLETNQLYKQAQLRGEV